MSAMCLFANPVVFPRVSFGHGVYTVSDPAGGWGGGGAKKHEIYVATFGGHLFYDLFVQGWGGHGPLGTSPGSATGT